MTTKCQVCILGRQPLTVKIIIYYHYSLFIKSWLQTKAADPKCKSDIFLLGLHFWVSGLWLQNIWFIIIIIIIHYSFNNFYSQRLPTHNANLTIKCQVCILGSWPLAAKIIIIIIHYSSNNFCSQTPPTKNANLIFYCQVCIMGRQPLTVKIIGWIMNNNNNK